MKTKPDLDTLDSRLTTLHLPFLKEHCQPLAARRREERARSQPQ